MRLGLRVLWTSCIAIILLHLWGAVRPSHYNWGVHYFAFYDLPISVSALFLSVLLFIPGVRRRITLALEQMMRRISGLPRFAIFAIASGIAVPVLIAFKAHAHLLGDSSLILYLTPKVPTIDDATANFRNQPLTYFLLRTTQLAIGGGGPVAIDYLYTVVDLAAGLAFLFLLLPWLTSPPLRSTIISEPTTSPWMPSLCTRSGSSSTASATRSTSSPRSPSMDGASTPVA